MHEQSFEGQGECIVGLCEGGVVELIKEPISGLSSFEENGKGAHKSTPPR